jgi:extracellular elastinolytic metalloproteinase
LRKRDQVDPVEALKGASSALALPIVANSATSEPEVQEAAETYVIKGASGTLKEPKAKLVYLQNSDGTLSLVWRLETDISDNWLLSYVDAASPKKVVGVVDYVTDASYTV